MNRKHASRTPNQPDHSGRGPGANWSVLLIAVGIMVVGVVIKALLSSPALRPQTPSLAQPSSAGQSVLSRTNRGPSEKEVALVDRINRANQLLAQSKPAEALELLQEAAKLSPEDEDVHYNLGIALSRLNRNDEAVKEYQEALRIFPDYAEVHNNLGNLYVRMGKREEAVQQFEQAVKINPEYASAWNNFGSLLQQLGRTNDALENFRKASQLDTNYWQARFNLATSYVQRRQIPEARTEFQTVLRLQPDFGPAKEALARLDRQTDSLPVPK
jgi:Tfp pilus assembly protein PilF